MQSSYRRAIILNLSASVVWASTSVMIRYVSAGFPVMFQSFARYLASLMVLWPLFFSAAPLEERRHVGANLAHLLPRMALIALMNFGFQAAYTGALYILYPGLAMLIYQSAAIFSVLLGFLFFADERCLLTRPLFYTGLAAAAAGVLLTVSPGSGGSSAPLTGVILVLAAALSWAGLTTMVRAWLPGFSPYFVNAAVFTFVTPLFLASHLLIEGPQVQFQASFSMWTVMILSGLIGIGLGHSLFYRSVPHLGVSLSNILQLTRPFFAAVFSFLIFGECLSPLQILGGLLLIGGAYSVTILRREKRVRE